MLYCRLLLLNLFNTNSTRLHRAVSVVLDLLLAFAYVIESDARWVRYTCCSSRPETSCCPLYFLYRVLGANLIIASSFKQYLLVLVIAWCCYFLMAISPDERLTSIHVDRILVWSGIALLKINFNAVSTCH